MQNVATDKSRIAALPLKADIGARQTNGNQMFRSFLETVEPIYHHPVEPKKSYLQSAGHVSANQASRQDERQPHSQNSRSTASTENNGHGRTQQQRDNPSAVNNANGRNDDDASRASKQTTEHDKQRTAVETAKQSTNESSHAAQGKSQSTDLPQDVAKQQSDSVIGADEQAMQSSGQTAAEVTDANALDDQQSQWVDWLELLENSHSVNLDRGNAGASQPSQAINSEHTLSELGTLEQQLAALSKLTEQQTQAMPAELRALMDKLKQLFESHNDATNVDAQLQLIPQGLEPVAQTQLELSKVGELDETLRALLGELKMLGDKHGNTDGLEALHKQLDSFTLTLQQTDIAQVEQGIDELALEQTLNADDLALLKAMLQDAKSIKGKGGVADTVSLKPATDVTLLDPQQGKVEPTVKQLLDLPDEKLDAALNNLANRVFPNTAPAGDKTLALAESVGNGQIDSTRKDFVASLKAGLEEIKAQLKQGHQPGIDLNALIVQSANVSNQGAEASLSRIAQASQQFFTAMEVSSELKSLSANTAVTAALDRLSAKEAQSSSVAQSKQVAQQMQHFDKAVNITRSEGHQQFVEKVRWMVNQNNLQADIRLDPPDLGAMKVKITMSGEAATVSIVVQSQQAKETLEQAAPRLKELLEQQGIELGQSSVEQEQHQTAQQEHSPGRAAGRDLQDDIEEQSVDVIEQPIRAGRLGGIDYFV